MTNTVALKNSSTTLADGTYEGLWSAYTITILDSTETLETVEGVRSFDGVPVIITVENGIATVTE